MKKNSFAVATQLMIALTVVMLLSFAAGQNAAADIVPGTVSTDPFDSTQGTVVVDHDTIIDPINAFSTSGGFEDGHTLMRNGGLDSVSFINFDTSSDVSIAGVRLFAQNDEVDCCLRRAMKHFKLLADTDGDAVFETTVVDTDINPYYNSQLGNVATGTGHLDLTLLAGGVITSQHWRLEVTQGSEEGEYEGARLVELDAIPAGEECEWIPETAWSEGTRYLQKGDWATYTMWTPGAEATLYAGKTMEAGTVVFSQVDVVDGDVTITITLDEGWRFADVEENVKIEGYESPPTRKPNLGKFTWKADADTNPFSIVVDAAGYYGVHVDVEREDCPEPEPSECITGTWYDEWGGSYTFIQSGTSITGYTSDDGYCGIYDASGTYEEPNFTLAITKRAGSPCEDWVTYTGTVTDCNNFSGTYLSGTGGIGPFIWCKDAPCAIGP
jgi:hypothetical protein